MQPALRRLNGCRAEAVLDLLDRVILAVVEDDLVVDDGVFDAGESPQPMPPPLPAWMKSS